MTAAAEFGMTTLGAFASAVARVAALVLLALGAAFVLMFAFAAALVVGVMILGAALAMRLWPRPAPAADVLEARRTPSGWVVEAATTRKS